MFAIALSKDGPIHPMEETHSTTQLKKIYRKYNDSKMCTEKEKNE